MSNKLGPLRRALVQFRPVVIQVGEHQIPMITRQMSVEMNLEEHVQELENSDPLTSTCSPSVRKVKYRL